MRFSSPRPRNDEERILPLINVVFLLLIFFMLAGRLAVSDPFEIAPPHSATEGPAEAQEMMVLVGADGRIALDGVIVAETALQAALAERLGDDGTAGVRLKADGRAEATRVVAVMERLREAGVKRLKLITMPAAH
jgi:biopolymer transport protein ExbD